MKKIILSILLVSSLLTANDTASIEKQVADVKAQIEALNMKLHGLEAQLPEELAQKIVEEEQAKTEEIKVAKKEEIKKDPTFKTHIEAGYTSNAGNTDTKTSNLLAQVRKDWDKHVIIFDVDAQWGKEDDEENKNKYTTEFNYYYKLTDRLALDYLVGYKEDKFSGFDSQFYTGPGLAYNLIKTEKHVLWTKGNILYARDDIKEGRKKEYAAYKAKIKYDWQMLENVKFAHETSYRSEIDYVENFFLYTKSGLSTKITDILSAGISYQIDYVNDPEDDKSSTDKTFLFSLAVDY